MILLNLFRGLERQSTLHKTIWLLELFYKSLYPSIGFNNYILITILLTYHVLTIKNHNHAIIAFEAIKSIGISFLSSSLLFCVSLFLFYFFSISPRVSHSFPFLPSFPSPLSPSTFLPLSSPHYLYSLSSFQTDYSIQSFSLSKTKISCVNKFKQIKILIKKKKKK